MARPFFLNCVEVAGPHTIKKHSPLCSTADNIPKMSMMNRREHKAVPGPTERDIFEVLKEYKQNEEVRIELLSPKGYVIGDLQIVASFSKLSMLKS